MTVILHIYDPDQQLNGYENMFRLTKGQELTIHVDHGSGAVDEYVVTKDRYGLTGTFSNGCWC